MKISHPRGTRFQASNALALLPAFCLATLCCGQVVFAQDTSATASSANAPAQNTNYEAELQAERAAAVPVPHVPVQNTNYEAELQAERAAAVPVVNTPSTVAGGQTMNTPATVVTVQTMNAPSTIAVAPVAEPQRVAQHGGSKTMTACATNSMYIAPPRFEAWPSPPSSTDMPQPSASIVPLTPGGVIMPKGTEDKRVYEFRADHMPLQTALAAFARANNLNIVPDQDVTGEVTLDVQGLSLEQMMNALVEAHDFGWTEENGLIRVRSVETRTFSIDYLRMIRTGLGTSTAQLSSGSSSGGGGGGTIGTSGSDIHLTQNNTVDFWKDLEDEIKHIVGTTGLSTLDKTAGLIQVTARPSVVKRVADFLAGINVNVERQVDIEVKIYDVTLNKGFQFGIDWVQLATMYGGTLGAGALTGPQAIGGTALGQNIIGGLTTLGSPLTNGLSASTGNPLVFNNKNTSIAVNALSQQGLVEVISQPRLRALNNQTALVTVGTDTPFFVQTSQLSQSTSGNVTTTSDTLTTVTVGTIMSITPQISDDGWITLDISPVLTALQGTQTSPDGTSTAPILDTKESSSLVRMRDGSTVVLGGLIQTTTAKNNTKVPLLGDIPWLGKLFTGTFDSKVKKELVIFITPTIVH